MPTPEIPREGDLKDISETTRTELLQVRESVQAVTAPEVSSHRDLLDAAINSGRRTEVIRALQHLQTRGEFSGLRDRIESTRIGVASSSREGASTPILSQADAGIVLGEQATRYTYQNLLPNWLKFSAIAGGATWLASRVLWLPARLFGKDAADAVAKWGNRAAAGVAVVGALAKGTTDAIQQGPASLLPPVARRNLPNALGGNPNPTVDIRERVQRVTKHLQSVRWVDAGNPASRDVEFPDLGDTREYPIESLQVTQFIDARSLGSNTITPLPSGTDPARRRYQMQPGVNRISIEFRVAGETNLQTIVVPR